MFSQDFEIKYEPEKCKVTVTLTFDLEDIMFIKHEVPATFDLQNLTS